MLAFPRCDVLPAPILFAARMARTAGLWMISPADVCRRWLVELPPLPPLWLRRQSGPIGLFESAAREMGELLASLHVIGPDDFVLDIGCGPGSMAPALSRVLGPRGRYLGVDTHAPSIRWCRRRFASDSRLRFLRTDRRPCSRLPVGDGEADFVLAKSLFTHLLQHEARRMLAEIRRALPSGRFAVVTAFLFERGDGERLASQYFPFALGSGSLRWRWRARPEAAVAVERLRFLHWIGDAGLEVQRFIPGFWPGAAQPRGQDVLVLAVRERSGAFLPCSRSAAAPKTP